MAESMAIVLAAGMGTRMKSDLPKVLSRACGRPLLHYVLDALDAAGVTRKVVVVGYRGELVREAVAGRAGIEFVEQTERLGTGHAVKMCRSQIDSFDGPVLVVAGDSPLIQTSSVRRLLEEFRKEQVGCLLGTLHKTDPTGLGRIVRDERGNFTGIVEEKDASEEQRRITEVNMSTYVFAARRLAQALDLLKNDNRQKEYYLTDCPAILMGEGDVVRALPILQPCESLSVNTPDELALVEVEMRRMGIIDA